MIDGNDRLCSRPQVQLAGAPPSFDDRCDTAFLNAATIAACAVAGPCPDGPANAALDWSPRVHASRSSASGAMPGPTARSMRSLLTGTLADFHHGLKTVVRYWFQNVHHSDAAAEPWSMLPFHDDSSAAASLSAPDRPADDSALVTAGSSRAASGSVTSFCSFAIESAVSGSAARSAP